MSVRMRSMEHYAKKVGTGPCPPKATYDLQRTEALNSWQVGSYAQAGLFKAGRRVLRARRDDRAGSLRLRQPKPQR
jgi:hypothetical protein